MTCCVNSVTGSPRTARLAASYVRQLRYGRRRASLRSFVARFWARSWLRSAANRASSDLTLSQISEKDFRKDVLPLLSDTLSTTPEEYTPEHLAVLLQLESLFKVGLPINRSHSTLTLTLLCAVQRRGRVPW